ncbi:hypothetical protein MMC22_008330 [Lobaria immixta]|nr:hypothetical protein [Lobaria immixta]
MAGNTPAVSTGAKDFGTISGNEGAVIGDVSGYATVIASQTNNNFQYPGRPDTPPNPSSNVPFRRDPDFVDRGTLLDEIHTKCSAPASRVALVGLGGVGKSQLAIQYCYQIREKWPETWIFWVHASNAARIEQGYRDIAEQVKIPGRQDPKADIFQLVAKWLRDENKGKWALILDNADDAVVLFKTYATSQEAQTSGFSGGPTQSLLAYLPQSLNGSILITTRTKNLALQLVEENDLLFIEPMDDTHALTLLEKKLGKEIDKDDTARLAAALEFMPLAIVQAAAYIRQRVSRYSVKQYVEDFYKNDKKKTSLLNHEAGHLRRDLEAKNSIIITWQISFDHIRQIRPSAANLLSLMSFFNRQRIPEALLKPHNAAKNKKNVDEDFEADIHTLRDYSFITTSKDGTTFEMHGLVQLAARKWLEAHDQLERWKQEYITNLFTVFPTGDDENWTKCQALFPHAKSAVAQQPATESSLQEWASILNHAAWYALTKGKYVEAEMMALKATETRKKIFGQENAETLRSMNLLASVYNFRGQWKKAEELNVQVMDKVKLMLGTEHQGTLASMGNLATTYWSQGRWNEAEQLGVQVMKTKKRVLGAEHPDTLTSTSNLASTYMNQGRLNEAKELEMQVMEIRKRVLGAEHPNTLASMGNLASTYQKQGRWNEAEELEVQVMETRKSVQGTESPDTLTSIGNLASTYKNQGRWNEAEELEVQVMEARKRVLGAEHPDTLGSMANLAFTWKSQGRNHDALSLLRKCFHLQKQKIGPQHPSTVASLKLLNDWQMESSAATSQNDSDLEQGPIS